MMCSSKIPVSEAVRATRHSILTMVWTCEGE
jgi:hypothetical protein